MGKFKVKKSGLSWWLHTKFQSTVYWNEYGQISLCFYFWNTVFQYIKAVGLVIVALLAALLGIVVLLVLFNFLLGIILFTTQQFYLFDNYISIELFVPLLLLSFSGIAGINLACLLEYLAVGRTPIQVFPDYMKKWVKKIEVKPAKEKQPSMLIAYLKAAKQKVCPLVEFED